MEPLRPHIKAGSILEELRRTIEDAFDVEFSFSGKMDDVVGRKIRMENPADKEQTEQDEEDR